MTRNVMVTDLNRCVSCLACMVACKEANDVPIGNYWLKVLRVGPNPVRDGAQFPNVEMYYLPIGCQHCDNPSCVHVCPTGASHKLGDGSVQVDKSKCIGCQFCVMACPYGVRYLNKDQGVVEKCTHCQQRTDAGELPACVIACGGRARYFGDKEQGWGSFKGSLDYDGNNIKLTDESYIEPFTDADVHSLPDAGNGPSDLFILRGKTWR